MKKEALTEKYLDLVTKLFRRFYEDAGLEYQFSDKSFRADVKFNLIAPDLDPIYHWHRTKEILDYRKSILDSYIASGAEYKKNLLADLRILKPAERKIILLQEEKHDKAHLQLLRAEIKEARDSYKFHKLQADAWRSALKVANELIKRGETL